MDLRFRNRPPSACWPLAPVRCCSFAGAAPDPGCLHDRVEGPLGNQRPFLFGPTMKVLTVVALGSVLAYAAFQQAAVDVRDWHWCSLAVGLIGVFHFLVARADRHPKMDLFACISLSVFVICAAVQLIPLPVGRSEEH